MAEQDPSAEFDRDRTLPDHPDGLGRILTITSNYPRWDGDATTPFVLHLAQDLQTLGWQVDVLAPHDAGALTDEVLGGVNVHRFRYLWPESAQTLCYRGGALINLRDSRGKALQAPPFVLAELSATLMRARSYDIIHSHWLLPQGFVGAMARRAIGTPHVTTIHGGDVFALRGAGLGRFKRAALAGADAVTVNSSATSAAVEPLLPDHRRLHRIPMGVRTDEPPRDDVARAREMFGDGELKILFVGRLVDEKGASDLIDAAAEIGDAIHLSVLIVGEGPERNHLEERATMNTISDTVEFTGWLDHDTVRALMEAADIYVGPSRRAADGWVEAYGLSFAEALAAGTPAIATRSGGIGDIIEDGVNGIVVDERSPAQIADAIRRLHHNKDLIEEYGRAGRQKAVERLSRRSTAEAFSQVFSSLIAR